jgi:hypothetical protein
MSRLTLRRASMLCATSFALAGCTSTTPDLDLRFGQSVRLINTMQTLHPDAARNDDPVAGIDGHAAKSAYDAYQKSYSAPEPQLNSFTIGVSGH